jgi:hypothetical protein
VVDLADWLIVGSIVAGFAGLIITYLFNERLNRRAFRREKLYELKLETYLDLLGSLNITLSATGALCDLAVREILKQLRRKSEESNSPSVPPDQLLQALRKQQWEALGFVEPATPPVDYSKPLVPYFAVTTLATRQSSRAYLRLLLLDFPDPLLRPMMDYFEKMKQIGASGGLPLPPMSDEQAERAQRDLDELGLEFRNLAESCHKDLLKTME